jgi:NADH:ubiquinone oxidoreductase subunit K
LEPLVNYLFVSAALFAIGVYGLVTKKNALRMLFAVEILINAANLNFVAFTRYLHPTTVTGQSLAMFSIALAAAEAAVGLAIILAVFRLRKDVDVSEIKGLRG